MKISINYVNWDCVYNLRICSTIKEYIGKLLSCLEFRLYFETLKSKLKVKTFYRTIIAQKMTKTWGLIYKPDSELNF